jgi:hypothetical protein
MYLSREDDLRQIGFSSDGIAGGGPPTLVLSTDNFDFDEEFGLRATFWFLVGVGTNLEVSYFGAWGWESSAEFVDPGNGIFSALSEFGNVPVGGYEETDEAARHFIEYSSRMNNIEANVRTRAISPSCRFQWSTLYGVRYFKLGENFQYTTMAVAHDDPLTPLVVDPLERGPGEMDYAIAVQNDMVGFQIGGDGWLCVVPGFSIGAEAKVGVYGNSAEQNTNIFCTSCGYTFEREADSEVAGLGEANAMAVLRLTPQLTLRAGYQILYVTNVGLAPAQFNATAPEAFGPPPGNPRTPFINLDGAVTYVGGTAGIEWTW